MKKMVVFFLAALPFTGSAQVYFYKLQFKDLAGKEFDLRSCQGKKVIVFTINAGNPDLQQLRSFDTLYRNNRNALQVVAVPVTDFGKPMTQAGLLKIMEPLNIQYTVTQTAMARKNAGEKQHPLIKWLTHKEQNEHLDVDVEGPDQVYVVDEQGTVFAVMKQKISPTGDKMKKVLARKINNKKS